MIKIAFVIDKIVSPTAGTEKQLLLLIKNLDRNKFDPHLCVLQSTAWLENEFDLCKKYVAGINSIMSLKSLKNTVALANYFRSNGISVVQTHFPDSSIVGIVAAKFAGVTKIVASRRNQDCRSLFESIIEKSLNYWVTSFIANSESTKKWAMANENIDSRKIHVIHNGLDFLPIPDDRSEVRKRIRTELGFSEKNLVIGIVANLRPIKNHTTFLMAARQVINILPDSRFLIVGSGFELRKLQNLCDELEISNHTFFLGERKNIPDLLSAFDLGVLSSDSESFSNALVEYMAAGLPVVTTNVGGADEAITEGMNGYIVPIGDHRAMAECIVRIFNSGRQHEMGANGREMAINKFSVKKMLADHEDVFGQAKYD